MTLEERMDALLKKYNTTRTEYEEVIQKSKDLELEPHRMEGEYRLLKELIDNTDKITEE